MQAHVQIFNDYIQNIFFAFYKQQPLKRLRA